jgi:hypothetical protein
MVAETMARRGALPHISDVDILDLVIPYPATPFFNEGLKFCGWTFLEDAELVGSRGVTCVGPWWSSFYTWLMLGINDPTDASSSLQGIASQCVLAAVAAYIYLY